MCFKLLFLIAFQIMRCACRKPLSVWLLFLCSSGHVCHSEEEQIHKNVNVDDLMPVPNLHFFIFSLFPTLSFSRSCCLFFLIFYLLVLSGHFSLFWPFKNGGQLLQSSWGLERRWKRWTLKYEAGIPLYYMFLIVNKLHEDRNKKNYIILSLNVFRLLWHLGPSSFCCRQKSLKIVVF